MVRAFCLADIESASFLLSVDITFSAVTSPHELHCGLCVVTVEQ